MLFLCYIIKRNYFLKKGDNLFGYIMINKPELKFKDFDKYKGYYCGLCQSLKKNHGLKGRLTLNYDMTFLIMLLSDLYDKEETLCNKRCAVHPLNKHIMIETNEISTYVSDMCLLLAYYKCVDDWNDEKQLFPFLFAKSIKSKIKKIQTKYPEKANYIEKKMNMLSIVENAQDLPVDKVARLFGEILGTVFAYKEDYFKKDLYRVGFYLGKFIYLLDAYEDVEKDLKTGDYNPFKEIFGEDDFEKKVEELLLLMIGEACDSFERLPLVKNTEIMRNILYSGVWIKYAEAKEKRLKNLKTKGENNGSI